MGLLDRVIGLAEKAVDAAERLAPEWGLRREVARGRREAFVNTGYSQHGASRTNKSMAGWQTSTGGPDADVVSNVELLRQRSRDLCMGDPLAISGLKTIRTNEVGGGLRLNSSIDAAFLGMNDDQAQAWQTNTEREFTLWAKDCDAEGRETFGGLQALARLSELMSGDVFALLPAIERNGSRYDLRVKLLEADRVLDPYPYPYGRDVLGGVEVDNAGAPVAYYIARVHPGDVLVPRGAGAFTSFAGGIGELPPIVSGVLTGALINKWDRIPARGDTGRPLVLHLMEADRPGQRRGVPVLAPVVEHLKQLTRYTKAELMAAVVSGMFTAAITSERATGGFSPSIPPQQQVKEHEPDPPSYQLGAGSIIELLPGEKLESVDPGRPNSGFQPFVQAICQQIGAGLGIPYELLVMQFTSSYSASRAALLEAWKRFVVGRHRVSTRFCQPIYEQWLEEAVARGYIVAPGFFSDPLTRNAWCRAEWHGPTQGQLDPVKEVTAAEMRVASGFSTRARETAELTGGNFEQNNKVRGREEQMRRDAQVVMAPGPLSPDEPESAAATTEAA